MRGRIVLWRSRGSFQLVCSVVGGLLAVGDWVRVLRPALQPGWSPALLIDGEPGATGAVDQVRLGLPRIEDCLVVDRVGYPCRDSKSTCLEMRNPTNLDQETVEGSKDSPFEENRFSELQLPLRENDDCL